MQDDNNKLPMIGKCKIHIKVLNEKNKQENEFYSVNTYLRFYLKGKKENLVKVKFVNDQVQSQEFYIISSNCSKDILKVDLFDEEFDMHVIDKIEIPLCDHNYGDHYIFNNTIRKPFITIAKVHFEIDFFPYYGLNEAYNNAEMLHYSKSTTSHKNEDSEHLSYEEETRRIAYEEKIRQLADKEVNRRIEYKEKINKLACEENAKRKSYEQEARRLVRDERNKRLSYRDRVKQLFDENASQIECEEKAKLLAEKEVKEVNLDHLEKEKAQNVEEVGKNSKDCDEIDVDFIDLLLNGEDTDNENNKTDEIEAKPLETQCKSENINENRLAFDEKVKQLANEEKARQLLYEENFKQRVYEEKTRRFVYKEKIKRLGYEEDLNQLAYKQKIRRLAYEEENKRLAYEKDSNKFFNVEKEIEGRSEIKSSSSSESIQSLSSPIKPTFGVKTNASLETKSAFVFRKKPISNLEPNVTSEQKSAFVFRKKPTSNLEPNVTSEPKSAFGLRKKPTSEPKSKFGFKLKSTSNLEPSVTSDPKKKTILDSRQFLSSNSKSNISFKLEHISEMSEKEKEEYFNILVNEKSDKKYEITIQEFYNLTSKINKVTDNQFNYMLDYYNYMQSKSDPNCQIIFVNLETLTLPMIKRIIKLKDFSFQYLSSKALQTCISSIFLYENLFKELGQLCFLNEKIAYNEIDNQNQRDNFLKKAKKIYYTLFDQINDEIRIFDGSKVVESHLFDGYNIEKVFIPSSVLMIQDNAFYRCKNLTTVSLECVNLTKIGKSAFSCCENLRSFVIPNKVEVIEEFTFKNCKKLENVVFPENLNEIKEKAFFGCASLTEIKLPKSIQKVGCGAFKKCKSLKSFIIPGVLFIYQDDLNVIFDDDEDSVRIENFTISSKCFSKCKNLQNVIIKEKCQMIDDSAFSLCSNLENVKISLSSNSKIGNFAFQNCESIQKVSIILEKESSLEIGNSSFQNCTKLTEVSFDHPELFSQDALKIGSSVFSGCINLSKFDFPPNCNEEIGEKCFDGCKSLNSVNLPSNLTKINAAMFKDCENLETINLESESITVIGSNSFENCGKLKLNSLPSNLVKIGDNAFRNCTLLDIKKFPSQIEEIGENAFEKCRFTEIEFPESMKVVHKKAFNSCTKLEKLTNYSQSLIIKKKAFYNCHKLKEIFTNNKDEFSTEAFEECAQGLDFFKIES